jgi:hypothetical protein
MHGREEQTTDGLDEDIERINNEADGVVQLAIQEREKHPDRADEVYEEALNRIRNEVFRDGALGPGTGALDPVPFLERLGEAFGRFEERTVSEHLDLRTIIEITQRAADAMGEKKYSLGQRADTPSGMKMVDVKVSLPPDKALHKVEAAGVCMENLVHLDLLEPYYDVFRCHLFYDPEDMRLTIKGRTEFVREALDEEIEPDDAEEE